MGSMPKTMAVVVMMIGRSRTRRLLRRLFLARVMPRLDGVFELSSGLLLVSRPVVRRADPVEEYARPRKRLILRP